MARFDSHPSCSFSKDVGIMSRSIRYRSDVGEKQCSISSLPMQSS